MVSREQARELALSLPEAVEEDHHGRPSFRVAGKIFATQWDDEHMNVMLDEGGRARRLRLGHLHRRPGICEGVWWGKRLAAVRVKLPAVDRRTLEAFLRDAWEGKAPTRLLRD